MTKESSKRARNNVKRGKSLERQVAKMILAAFRESDFDEEFEDDDVFRTPIPPPPGFSCDISFKSPTIKKLFPWGIECKSVQSLPTLERLLVKGITALWKGYWEQAVDRAISMNVVPMLVWRRGPKEPILCAIPQLWDKITDYEMPLEDELSREDLFTTWFDGLTAGSQVALVVIVFILIAKRDKK